MASTAGVAFKLEGLSLQFAAIQAQLAPPAAAETQPEAWYDEAEHPLLPVQLPAQLAALSKAVAAIRALSSAALPFAAHALGQDQLRVVTLKQHVAGVFKLLRQKQGSCGIILKDVKSCVSLAPLPARELEQAVTCGLLSSLLPRGWHQLDEGRLLGASVMQPSTDGSAQVCASLTMGVHAEPADKPDKLHLLVKAEQVEFRHPACRPGASLQQRSASLAGSECTLLPDLRPALIQRFRPADPATLARLRQRWASYGMPLLSEVECLVDVSLDCDPDAPTFPYPPCCVLGPSGLLSTASKHTQHAVQAVLAKLLADLAATPVKFLGGNFKVGEAREWFPDGTPQPQRSRHNQAQAAPQRVAFLTARQLADQGKRSTAGAPQLALGGTIDVSSFAAVELGTQQQRQKRERFEAGPKLLAAFESAKKEQAEAEKPAAARLTPFMAAVAAARAASAAPGQKPLAVRVGGGPATAIPGQKRAVPAFKRGPALPPSAPGKAAAGRKRAQGAKPPAGAKRAKAAGAVPLGDSAAAMPGSCAASPSIAGPSGLPPPSATAAEADTAPPSAAKPAAGKGKARAGAGAEGSSAAAAAAVPKAPTTKPRQKAADIDVAAVTAKVIQMHGAGTLGKLTIPELKAYLKSVKAPVGGKKGELEERVMQRLGGGAVAATAVDAAA